MTTLSILTATYAVAYNAIATDGTVTHVTLSDLSASALSDTLRFIANVNRSGEWHVPCVAVSHDQWQAVGHYWPADYWRTADAIDVAVDSARGV